jgi:hypothetical protein
MNDIYNYDNIKLDLPRQLTGFQLVLGYLIFLSSIITLVWLLIVEFPKFIER